MTLPKYLNRPVPVDRPACPDEGIDCLFCDNAPMGRSCPRVFHHGEKIEAYINIATQCPACKNRSTRHVKPCPGEAMVNAFLAKLRAGTTSMSGKLECGDFDMED